MIKDVIVEGFNYGIANTGGDKIGYTMEGITVRNQLQHQNFNRFTPFSTSGQNATFNYNLP